jgi:hypothetical protein
MYSPILAISLRTILFSFSITHMIFRQFRQEKEVIIGSVVIAMAFPLGPRVMVYPAAPECITLIYDTQTYAL